MELLVIVAFCAASFGLIWFLKSRNTYQIPIESFKQQFLNADALKLKQVSTRDPFGEIERYQTLSVDVIHCIDKQGKPATVKSGPAIEIRFTDDNNRRTTFLFDLMRVDQTSVTGSISRLLPDMKKTIPLSAIRKIEIQKNLKKYRYVN